MLRVWVLVSLSCLSAMCLAQTVFEEIASNPHLCGNNYCIYPDSDHHQYTPAPEGKKPFYLSHYGRHGSRHMSQNNGYDIPFEILSRADSLGKLTALGKNVFMKVSIAREDAMDRWGDLTGWVPGSIGISPEEWWRISRRFLRAVPISMRAVRRRYVAYCPWVPLSSR